MPPRTRKSIIIPVFFFILLLPALAWGSHAAGEPESHPITVRDLIMLDRVSGPAVSPDGQWIVYTLRSTDLEANSAHTSLWIARRDGGIETRKLAPGTGSDSNACWSTDGKTLYFLSTRSNRSQVWKCSPEGGDAVQVTDEPLDVGNLELSPDGRLLAYSMEVFPGTGPAETAARLDSVGPEADGRETGRDTGGLNASSGRIYDRLFIRHWDTWADGRRSHIFVHPAGGGETVDVMRGMEADSPEKPFGDTADFTITPDGAAVVFTAIDAGREEAWTPDRDLFFAPVTGGVPPRCLTCTNPASDSSPVFSPDGKTLAYLATSRPGFESDRNRIMLRPWPDGNATVLAESWDRSPSAIAWSPDGQTLYAIAPDHGQTTLSAIHVPGGERTTLVPEGRVSAVAMANDRVVFCHEDLDSPADLWSVRPDGTDLRRITDVNRRRLAPVRMGDFEQFTFPGWNNETVYAYMVKPVNFDPDTRYPVALLIHGGPQDSMGNKFHYRWNPQPYAGKGYAVVMIDFHGSTGYGQEFCDSISGDWGGKPLEDLQKGLNASLDRYPWMDGDRVSALGASYGGYMVNWIAGTWPGRFRCLVSHDGPLDNRMEYYTTDELWFDEWEHNGMPWENPDGYARHNPVLHVQDWKTPMLVIQGGKDYRVADTQGFATFTALQRRGIPSQLLYFPDENHWVQKPQNSIFWYTTVLDWLDHWTAVPGSSTV